MPYGKLAVFIVGHRTHTNLQEFLQIGWKEDGTIINL